jgi:hypothetical protein
VIIAIKSSKYNVRPNIMAAMKNAALISPQMQPLLELLLSRISIIPIVRIENKVVNPNRLNRFFVF